MKTMNKNINDIFKPEAAIPFLKESIHHNNCKCGRDIDYDMFLIDEYGIDTYLRVKKEEQRQKEMMENFGKINELDLIPILACLMAFNPVQDDETDSDDIRMGDVVMFKHSNEILGVVLNIEDGYGSILKKNGNVTYHLLDICERYKGDNPIVMDNLIQIRNHLQEIYKLLKTLR